MTEVGHMSPTAHVSIYTLNVNDPDGTGVVIRKTTASHLFMRRAKIGLVGVGKVEVNLETVLF